ncbi:MAG: plasmid pRiA4b ORF-3 family protein [Desulfobulbaceae bacterium]|nr:plasmid pRiA4b ORF-3 family protein [Desulfobulbaceae bacterium]
MAEIIEGKFPKTRKPISNASKPGTPGAVYQLKVTLKHCKPPIWRRVLVPGHLSLAKLHDVLQISLGWTDTHLHQFTIGKNHYGDPSTDEGWGLSKILDERRHKLCDLESAIAKGFTYEYDFGDGWEHQIKVEKIVPPEENPPRHPLLLGGKRACPPEDVGGPYGYQEFLEAIADPEHEEHEAIQEWLDDDFDPDFFDLTEINELLRKIK